MPTFKKHLITDCLVDPQSADDQECGQADQVTVTCENFESRINDLLDSRVELSTDSSLRGHADGCLTCRQTLGQYEQLALVLSSGRSDVSDVSVERRIGASQRQSKLWQNLPTTIFAPLSVVALLALFFVAGKPATNVDALPSVAVASVDSKSLIEADSPEVAVASSDALPAIEPVSWSSQRSVQQLQGLVASGSELLARKREQVAVIQGLSDVRLDLSLVELEAQLASLQPVLNYSGRIPALSPMQGTLCFTLGWLKKGKATDQPKLDSIPDEGADLGMRSLALRYLA